VGATFPRVKTWTTEIATNTDLNAEFDNILNNLDPDGVDDYSVNVAQMRLQTNPGEVGSESLATSLAGELERLRYVIKRIIGLSVDYWHENPPSTLTDLVASIGSGLPTYRIVQGQTTGNSSQLRALIPSGTTASVTLTASTTTFQYYINNVAYNITSNITLTGLSLGPAANNTCSFNNTAASGQQWTKFKGMYGTQIDVDGMQSNMAALVGQIVGLKSGNEYMVGYLNSTTAITNVWRGAMFNSSGNNITAVGLSDNAEIKLMKLAWIFANTNSTLAVTYTNPTISGEQPTSPNTGDYWFDLANTAWKTYNSTTWVDASATLVGLTMQDTAACVAARTFDIYRAQSGVQTLTLDRLSNSEVKATQVGGEACVFGISNQFGLSRPIWDVTTDLESGLNETLSINYYAYMKESGVTVLSDRAPLDRRDLKGLYHPGETWRCLGSVYNGTSTHFVTPVVTYRDIGQAMPLMGDINAYVDYTSTRASSSYYLPSMVFPSSYIQEHGAAASFTAASGAYQDCGTITLTRGLWQISAMSELVATGTMSAAASWNMSLALEVGTAAQTNQTLGENWVRTGMGGNLSNVSSLVIPNWHVFITASSTYFLKFAVSNTAGATWQASYGSIRAKRLDDLTSQP
jgi:hypothetical protein